MKYKVDVVINKPKAQVVELFDNPENLVKWMDGLASFDNISGEPGKPGTKSRLVFINGKRQFEMIETILTNELPDEMTGTYEAPGSKSFIKVNFDPVDEQSTRYTTEQEFTLSGFMKIMAFFMPGAFKKQSLKYMLAFKDFAESQPD